MIFFAFWVEFMRMSDFHPITLLMGSNPQIFSPFMRFLTEPLHKWNVVHAYLEMSNPAFVFFKREIRAFCMEFTDEPG